jgi:hypothetical protein
VKPVLVSAVSFTILANEKWLYNLKKVRLEYHLAINNISRNWLIVLLRKSKNLRPPSYITECRLSPIIIIVKKT